MKSIGIVGAGPVGLTLALELAKYGIPTDVYELLNEVNPHPRARGINTRSMEIFRQLGLEEHIRKFEFPDESARFTYMTRLGGEVVGHVIAHIDRSGKDSPVSRTMISQDRLEEILESECLRQPLINLQRGCKAEWVGEFDEGVRVKVTGLSDGLERELSHSYLVACDGGQSEVREALEIPLESSRELGTFESVFCRVDIRPLIGFDSLGIIFTDKQHSRYTLMSSMDGRWVFSTGLAEGERRDTSFEEAQRMIRETFSLGDLPIEVENISYWKMGTGIAQTFRSSRTFLAGDAAHKVPPTGGFGMNLGIQDAHNLAWKLALVLRGRLSADLLDSYEKERKPMAAAIAKWSETNAHRLRATFEATAKGDLDELRRLLNDMTHHVNAPGLDLGLSYEASSVVLEDGTNGTSAPEKYIPSGSPGARAPHFWQDGASSLDLFEGRFTVVTAKKDDRAKHAAELFDKAGLPSRQVTVEEAGELYQLNDSGCAIVRPDGHILWRGDLSHAEKVVNRFLF